MNHACVFLVIFFNGRRFFCTFHLGKCGWVANSRDSKQTMTHFVAKIEIEGPKRSGHFSCMAAAACVWTIRVRRRFYAWRPSSETATILLFFFYMASAWNFYVRRMAYQAEWDFICKWVWYFRYVHSKIVGVDECINFWRFFFAKIQTAWTYIICGNFFGFASQYFNFKMASYQTRHRHSQKYMV